jgi:putative two-component system response regulator
VKRPKILIVDDQQINRLLLRKLLKEYTIIEASNGEAALRLAIAKKPDLIILDIIMPKPDGYSVLSTLKNNPATWLIPVILVSTLQGMDEKIKSLEKGADDFISKPFNPLELKARVKSLLRIKKLQEELVMVQHIVVSLATAMEAKDDYSANHSLRTSYYAGKLAKRLMLSDSEQKHIKVAGFLHDLGKIGIKDRIFCKPEALSPDEFEVIKSHPLIGEKICSSISAFEPILPIIRHHHERFDGKGYPDGLKGTTIPLGARIMAIADAYDALTTDRSYRKAYSKSAAWKILHKNEGPQWDPELVEIFCQMLEKEDFLIHHDFASPTLLLLAEG